MEGLRRVRGEQRYDGSLLAAIRVRDGTQYDIRDDVVRLATDDEVREAETQRTALLNSKAWKGMVEYSTFDGHTRDDKQLDASGSVDQIQKVFDEAISQSDAIDIILRARRVIPEEKP